MQGVVVGLLIAIGVLMLITLGVVCLTAAVLIDRTKQIADIPAKLNTLAMQMNMSYGPDMPQAPIFRSMDGRYEASSLDELIAKMQADPTSGLTPGDAEDLRKMFEGLTSDDDDDDLEDWQKKGKK